MPPMINVAVIVDSLSCYPFGLHVPFAPEARTSPVELAVEESQSTHP